MLGLLIIYNSSVSSNLKLINSFITSPVCSCVMTRVSLPAASSSGSKKNGSWPGLLSKSVGDHFKVNDKPV